MQELFPPVYQEDYDKFYVRVMDLVKYGKVCHSAFEIVPQNMTEEEADIYYFHRRCDQNAQMKNFYINLRGKEHGDYIDSVYKERYVILRYKYNNRKISFEEIEKFEKEVALAIKKKMVFQANNFDFKKTFDLMRKSGGLSLYSSCDWDKVYELSQKELSRNKKQSIWDKIKEWFD
jgi:hypothetical protein